MAYKNIEINPSKYNKQHTNKQSQFYVGYSTVDPAAISTKLYDFELIKQDILNQFNTRQGERVMLPTFGSLIWNIIFEPFTDTIKEAIKDDVNRICNSDPRAVPIQINIVEQEYGMMLEVTLQYVGTDQTSNMSLTFDKNQGLAVQ